jgi:hypothetical protein
MEIPYRGTADKITEFNAEVEKVCSNSYGIIILSIVIL